MEWTREQAQAIDAVGAWLKNKNKPVFKIHGYAGVGKAQPLTAMIQAPNGPVRMGDLEVGAEVLGRNGKPTIVTDIFPQGKIKAYRVSFRDGSFTECSGEHLWNVTNANKERRKWKPRLKTTLEMLNAVVTRPGGDSKFRVPLCLPVEFDSPAAPFDPYTIGVLLGDGYIKGTIVSFYCVDDAIAQRVEMALPEPLILSSDYNRPCPKHTIKDTSPERINILKRHLEAQGMAVGAGDKSIPRQYLYAPIQDRIDLLRGLMDTDGSASSNRVQFTTTSEKLARDVRTLVQSLGGTVITHLYERKDKKSKEFHLNVKLLINPFSLERKASLWRPSKKNPPSRFITSIEEIAPVEQQCISVSAEDGLYLTDEFIVTHNSTIASHLAEDTKTLFLAYTGKAASVLRKKGIPDAQTIHSALYNPRGADRTRLYELKERMSTETNYEIRHELSREYDAEARRCKRPTFSVNPLSIIHDYDLIFIDEASMVSQRIAADLESFRKPILIAGDPFQLPPVKGYGVYMSGKPDVMLTEIMRQALENPIIRWSMDIRSGKILPYGRTADGLCEKAQRGQVHNKQIFSASQVITGKNETRRLLNAQARKLLGFSGTYPMKGEKLVMLQNNKTFGVLNGVVCTALSSKPDLYREFLEAEIEYEGEFKELPLCTSQFHAYDYPECADDLDFMHTWKVPADFGYALTVHKAQGSQWDSVCLVDDGLNKRDPNTRNRWLYTAVTRAERKLLIVA